MARRERGNFGDEGKKESVAAEMGGHVSVAAEPATVTAVSPSLSPGTTEIEDELNITQVAAAPRAATAAAAPFSYSEKAPAVGEDKEESSLGPIPSWTSSGGSSGQQPQPDTNDNDGPNANANATVYLILKIVGSIVSVVVIIAVYCLSSQEVRQNFRFSCCNCCNS